MQETVTFDNEFFKGSVMLDSINKTSYFVVPGEPIVKVGCIYMGSVQYLSHEERVAIIRSSGEDYDILPRGFEGPETIEVPTTKYMTQKEIGLTLIREWDGTVNVVKVVTGLHMFPDGTFLGTAIKYSDGVCHKVTTKYLNSLKEAVFSGIQHSKENGYW